MKNFSRLSLALFLSWPGALEAQNYAMSTVAGHTLVADGQAATQAFLRNPQAVALDSSGNLYIADFDENRVFRVDPFGVLTVFAGNGIDSSFGDGGLARLASLSGPNSLAIDSSNNVYIGEVNGNRVRKVTPDGRISTYAGNGSNQAVGDGGLATQAGLQAFAMAVDKAGNLYISQGNAIRMVNAATGIITVFAGNYTVAYSGDGGQATSAGLGIVNGIAIDAAGNVYLADHAYGVIRKVDSRGGITTIAGTGISGYSGDGGLALAAQVNPYRLAVDPAGTVLYTSDVEHDAVRRIDLASGRISLAAGTPFVQGFSGDGTSVALLLFPSDLVLDSAKSLYIADSSNHRIRKINSGIFTTVAGTSVNDGPASQAFINHPVGVTLGNNRSLYMADYGTGLIRQLNLAGNTISSLPCCESFAEAVAVDPSGNVFTSSNNWYIYRFPGNGQVLPFAGSGSMGYQDGGVSQAKIGHVLSMATDTAGNLYFTDFEGARIRKVDTLGNISTVAGTGSRVFSPDGTSALAASMDPEVIAIDKSGAIYFSDFSNHCVRKFMLGGNLSTVAGTPYAPGYSSDGTLATRAFLRFPTGIAFDAGGLLYIADQGNAAIRKVQADGTIQTIAGARLSLPFNGDGPSPFLNIDPSRLVVDPAGNVYFSDYSNDRIRKLTPVFPAKLTINGGDMQSAPANSQLPRALSVKVTDAAGNPFAGAVVNFSVSSGTATVNPPSAKTGTDGTANASVFFGGTVGAVAVTASVVGVSAVVFNLTATKPPPVPAMLSFVSGDGQKGVVGSTLPDRLAVLVTGSDGAPFAGATVHVALAYGSATWDPPKDQTTGVDGKISITITLGKMAGSIGISANVNSLYATARLIATPDPNTPMIFPGGIVSAGLSSPPVQTISPNAIVSIFGSNFAPPGTSRAVTGSDLVGGAVPTKLASVCVAFGSQLAPIFLVTPGQLNVQVPAISPPAFVSVQVTRNCGTSDALTSGPVLVPTGFASPEFFYSAVNADGRNPIAATDGVTGAGIGDPARLGVGFALAYPGEVLTMYATGLGLTTPAFAPGDLPSFASQVSGLTVRVDGVLVSPVNVPYAGVTPLNAGLYQVNLIVPVGLTPGDHTITLTVASATSPAKAFFSVGTAP